MTTEQLIECRATRWFYLRVWAMVFMFGIFLFLFLKDWKIGWPNKNEVFYTYKAFEEAEKLFSGQDWSAEEWASEVSRRKTFPQEDVVLPSSVDRNTGWPSLLADYQAYSELSVEEGKKITPPMWIQYTDERGWSSGIPEKSYSAGKIQEQLYYGIGSGLLLVAALAILWRTSRRSMSADNEAFYAPGGERVEYSLIRKIDARKWQTKGLAYVYYEGRQDERDALLKAKIDGMVYGQFKQEEGAPAEVLFQKILKNFRGELVELVEDEPERTGENVDNSSPDQVE